MDIKSSPAYRIKNDSIEVIEFTGSYILPEGVTTGNREGEIVPFALLQGEEHALFKEHGLEKLKDIATLLTPWTTWYLAPNYVSDGPSGGVAWRESDLTAIKTNLCPAYVVQAAFHEAWHLCEGDINGALLENLDQQLAASGPTWPGDYYPKPCERRARAFAAFATAIYEGLPINISGPEVSPHIKLFWSVYSGEFGRLMMKEQNRNFQPVPGKIRRALAQVWGG